MFQGLISITKDTLRSTENFKKVFEHGGSHNLAPQSSTSEASTDRKKFLAQGHTSKLTWRHPLGCRPSANRFLHSQGNLDR